MDEQPNDEGLVAKTALWSVVAVASGFLAVCFTVGMILGEAARLIARLTGRSGSGADGPID